MISFEEMGLRPEILRAVQKLGFETPMPVQEQVIPAMLADSGDIVALAQTGTGKTAAFGIPLLQVLDEGTKTPQGIILCPTRELCMQVANDIRSYAQFMPWVSVVSVYGGASIDNQIHELKRGAQIIVATPGRMNDIIRRKKVNLNEINSLVLDEADEMLNMGFQEELDTILEQLPAERRTLLFSATMPKEVANISRKYLKNSREISIGVKNSGAENVKHYFYTVRAHDRYLALKRIVDYYPKIYGIIFCRTREETRDVAAKLMKDGYNADALHGDLSQSQRDYAMQKFRDRALQMLVATDVAARGLDVDDLTHVINYNLPDELESYVHRSGRTGRAGKSGISISLVSTRDKSKISVLEKSIKKKFDSRPIPDGRECCEKQLFNMVETMEKVTVNDEEIDDFLPVIYKKLEWMTREELIKRFVSTEFNRFLEYYKDAPDLNVREDRRPERGERGERGERSDRPARPGAPGERRRFDDEGLVPFRINLGFRDGLSPTDLLRLIKDYTPKTKVKVGKVTIMKNDTIFEADGEYADMLMDAFRDAYIEDRKISLRKTASRPAERTFESKRRFR